MIWILVMVSTFWVQVPEVSHMPQKIAAFYEESNCQRASEQLKAAAEPNVHFLCLPTSRSERGY